MNAIEIALYLGLFFIVGGFLLFVYSEMRLAELDRQQWKNDQLIKSVIKDKQFEIDADGTETEKDSIL